MHVGSPLSVSALWAPVLPLPPSCRIHPSHPTVPCSLIPLRRQLEPEISSTKAGRGKEETPGCSPRSTTPAGRVLSMRGPVRPEAVSAASAPDLHVWGRLGKPL